jgi:hypothetical protein
MVVAELLRDAIWTASATSPRSLQVSIGASEIGGECDRQIAYRAAGTPAVNFPDPMRTLAGIGLHLALAEAFRRLDAGSGRYLVEERLVYRGIPGSCDLYDRRRRMVVDWKSILLKKAAHVRHDGPPAKYVTQGQLYAAALAERGEDVQDVAIVWLALDGTLADLQAHVTAYDRAAADAAVDRYEAIRAHASLDGPQAVEPSPTRLCPWCAHHRPGATNHAVACPGQN